MKNAGSLPKLFLTAAFLTILCATAVYSQGAAPPAPVVPRVTESEQRLGAFSLGGQSFQVTTRSQTVSSASNKRFATTVSELEIRDSNGGVAYAETFSAALADGKFLQTLTISGSVLQGAGGGALVLRFLEDPAPPGGPESWQMFGMVNGKLTRYTAPLPLGQGGSAVNDVLTGIMLRGGIGVVPLASTAEALEFRVWAGNFFIAVPVRMDWASGQWSEAQQCFANDTGKLEPVGCNLRVTAARRPVPEGNFITLYAQPQENAYTAQQVPVHGNSAVEFPAVRALAHWQNNGDRFTCSFDQLWLHVIIDGKDGWVHSATDFAALGLPPAL